MTEFKCGNCREVHVLNSKARFCPNCGSSSLLLVLNELAEPAQKESLGVVNPPLSAVEMLHLDTGNIPVEELVPKDVKLRKSGRTGTRS